MKTYMKITESAEENGRTYDVSNALMYTESEGQRYGRYAGMGSDLHFPSMKLKNRT